MTAPSNANTSGLEVVAWRFRTAPHRNWHRTNCSKVIEQERLDGSEVEVDLVTAASAQARIAELQALVASIRRAQRDVIRAEIEQEGYTPISDAEDRATAAEARADRLAKALEDIDNVADSFCDDSADLLAGQIRIRTRAALQQEG